MKRNLLICFLPESDRSAPEICWRACVQWGPLVEHKTRRTALRRAVQKWLEERTVEKVTSFAVNLALKEMKVIQVQRPIGITYFNQLDGGRG